MVKAQTFPHCAGCDRELSPWISWVGSNWCKAMHLIGFLVVEPGLSTAELAQRSGLAYADATRGMQKARETGLVVYESEERAQGGVRYRYAVAPDAGGRREQWLIRELSERRRDLLSQVP